MGTRNRIEVMHGVNLDQLGRRDPEHYGGLNFDRGSGSSRASSA
jgi:3-dehydroquinate dehydratase